MAADCISEHEILPGWFNPTEPRKEYAQMNGFLLNPEEKDELVRKYFFIWSNVGGQYAYHATYVIGAQWITDDKPLVVTTDKFEQIDFLKMFSICLSSGIESETFSKLYGVSVGQPEIEVNSLDSVLSPLMVVHFISVLQRLISRGLRKDYIYRGDNLKKVKGRIDVYRNDRINVINGRLDRIYCRYQEYSEDITENRLLKKALLFSERIISRMSGNQSCAKLTQQLRGCLSAFSNVSDNIVASELSRIKTNQLFKDYPEALRLAKLILDRYDFSINKASENSDTVPPFWIDMPLLFEHYVLGLLKERFGNAVSYQFKGYSGFPDFILKTGEAKMILDTKYKTDSHHFDPENIRQLSGYARDKRILTALDVNEYTIVPGVFIYPSSSGKGISVFSSVEDFFSIPSKKYSQFYEVEVNIPLLVDHE